MSWSARVGDVGMRIGIVGAGHIGGTAAKLFAKAGHLVAVSNSRGPATLASLVSSIGPNAKASSVVEAVQFGEAVLLALPYRKIDSLPPAESFAGKIVIDAMNPYSAVGRVMDLGESTSSEEVAKRMPGAHLVTASANNTPRTALRRSVSFSISCGLPSMMTTSRQVSSPRCAWALARIERRNACCP